MNSAGAAGNFVAPIASLSPNAFKSVLDIDTIGTFNTVKATVDYLVESASKYPGASAAGADPSAISGGKFLAVSATFHYTGLPLQAHVSAAKAAVDSIVASVALEYGPRGVMANVIAPGPIEGTEGMSRLSSPGHVADEASKSAQQPGTRGGSPSIPSGRWGSVRDISDATVYLFSATGDNVNGHVLVVDGGAWRRQGSSAGVGLDPGMEYPGFLLAGEMSAKLKGGKSKSKL